MSKINDSVYTYDEQLIELIVKYTGNLNRLVDDGFDVEILSCSYAIINTNINRLDELVMYDEIEYIEKSKELAGEINELKSDICYNKVQQELDINLTGEGVLVGIIDSGIDYKHKDFRNEDGTTRIKYIWDLSQDGNPPKGSKKGTVYTEEEINGSLNKINIINHYDFIGHGTAVAGICVGNGNESNQEAVGIAPLANIIVVKVNERVFDNFAKNTDIMRAIKFIIDKAILLKMPVVINISFGTNDGSHDGTSLFETYIDEMCDIHKNNIVIPTGNEGVSGHHYYEKIVDKEKSRIEFQTSQTLKKFSISIWKYYTDVIEIELIASNGNRTGILVEDNKIKRFVLGNYEVSIIFINPTPYTVNQEIFFNFKAVSDIIQNEIWFLEVYGKKIVVGDIDIWLPVLEQSGSDTFFLKSEINTTLTIPSTSFRCITVGGYDDELGTYANFSGRGFNRNGIVKPDLVAPSTNIKSTKVGGGYSNFTGTSFAAPFVTGSIALMMQWGIVLKNDVFLYGQRSKALLHRGAKRDININYPNEMYGFGKLCIGDSLLLNRDIGMTDVRQEDEELSIIVDYNEGSKIFLQSIDYIKYEKELEDLYAIIKIPVKKLDEFEATAGLFVQYYLPTVLTLCDQSSMEAAGITEVQTQSFLELDGFGTLVAIIDTGIDYNNEVFKYEDNTSKIEYIWDMTIEGNPPEGFTFGSEYDNSQINEAINSENGYEIVPSVDVNGHGTFLSSIAAGRKDSEGNIGASPESKLIIVKLRQSSSVVNEINYISEDSTIDKYSSIDIVLALEYIISKKRTEIKPISIGIFQGTNTGAHDGKGIFEKYIEFIGLKLGTFISVPAGNEADKQHHTKISIPINETYVDIELMVGEGEEKFPCELWSYNADTISIAIISPLGEETGIIKAKNNISYNMGFTLENTIVNVKYNIYPGNGNQRTRIGFLNPTRGIWTIRVYGGEIINGIIHGWLPCDGLISNGTYFVNSDPEYTITVPSTAKNCITVGGYNHYDNSLFPSSGRGPSRDFMLKPSFVAPSVNVLGQLPDGIGTMTGTSVGNAHVVGAASLIMQWIINKNLIEKINTPVIGSILIRGCEQFTQLNSENVITGFGKMNLINSFEKLK